MVLLGNDLVAAFACLHEADSTCTHDNTSDNVSRQCLRRLELRITRPRLVFQFEHSDHRREYLAADLLRYIARPIEQIRESQSVERVNHTICSPVDQAVAVCGVCLLLYLRHRLCCGLLRLCCRGMCGRVNILLRWIGVYVCICHLMLPLIFSR